MRISDCAFVIARVAVPAVGADAVPAQFIAGVGNLDEADVTFPIAWP